MNIRNSFRFPCGVTRRESIGQMAGGFAALALSGMLEADGAWEDSKTTSPLLPLAPKPAHLPCKAKSCIFLLMNGGPSQVDTFDPKPALEKHAGQAMPSDKKFINSGGRAIGYLAPAARPFRPGAKAAFLSRTSFLIFANMSTRWP